MSLGEEAIAFSFMPSLIMACVLLFVVLPISHPIIFAELNVQELLNTIGIREN